MANQKKDLIWDQLTRHARTNETFSSVTEKWQNVKSLENTISIFSHLGHNSFDSNKHTSFTSRTWFFCRWIHQLFQLVVVVAIKCDHKFHHAAIQSALMVSIISRWSASNHPSSQCFVSYHCWSFYELISCRLFHWLEWRQIERNKHSRHSLPTLNE